MTVRNLDQVIAAVAAASAGLRWSPGTFDVGWSANEPRSLWRLAQFWGRGASVAAGAYNTTLNGATLSGNQAGAIYINNAPTGKVNYIISAQVGGNINMAWTRYLDRIWQNRPVATTTGSQAISSPTWPARDDNASTNGLGVQLAIEISTGMGAASPNISVAYTNSDGTASRSGTVMQVRNSLQQDAFIPVRLQGSDKGVRSVQDINLDASWLSGTMNMVAYREVYFISGMVSWGSFSQGFLQNGLKPIYADSTIFRVGHSSSTASGHLVYQDWITLMAA